MTKTNRVPPYSWVHGPIMTTAYQLAARKMNIPVSALRIKLSTNNSPQDELRSQKLFAAINQPSMVPSRQDELHLHTLPHKEAEDLIRSYASPIAEVLVAHLSPSPHP